MSNYTKFLRAIDGIDLKGELIKHNEELAEIVFEMQRRVLKSDKKAAALRALATVAHMVMQAQDEAPRAKTQKIHKVGA